MKLVQLEYLTKKGIKLNGKFIKTIRGYIPVFLDDRTFLDKSNKIIKEEELTLEKINSELNLY